MPSLNGRDYLDEELGRCVDDVQEKPSSHIVRRNGNHAVAVDGFGGFVNTWGPKGAKAMDDGYLEGLSGQKNNLHEIMQNKDNDPSARSVSGELIRDAIRNGPRSVEGEHEPDHRHCPSCRMIYEWPHHTVCGECQGPLELIKLQEQKKKPRPIPTRNIWG